MIRCKCILDIYSLLQRLIYYLCVYISFFQPTFPFFHFTFLFIIILLICYEKVPLFLSFLLLLFPFPPFSVKKACIGTFLYPKNCIIHAVPLLASKDCSLLFPQHCLNATSLLSGICPMIVTLPLLPFHINC